MTRNDIAGEPIPLLLDCRCVGDFAKISSQRRCARFPPTSLVRSWRFVKMPARHIIEAIYYTTITHIVCVPPPLKDKTKIGWENEQEGFQGLRTPRDGVKNKRSDG